MWELISGRACSLMFSTLVVPALVAPAWRLVHLAVRCVHVMRFALAEAVAHRYKEALACDRGNEPSPLRVDRHTRSGEVADALAVRVAVGYGSKHFCIDPTVRQKSDSIDCIDDARIP